LPTHEVLCKLNDEEKVTSEWFTQNEVLGMKFTDKSTNHSIFLPAVGGRLTSTGALCDITFDGPRFDVVGESGNYWSSTGDGETDGVFGYLLWFSKDIEKNMNRTNGRRFGFSIRSVAEKL